MPMYIDEAEEEREQEIAKQRMAWAERDKERGRKHEQELLKLKLEATKQQKKAIRGLEVLQRCVIALIKLPTLPFAFTLVYAFLRRAQPAPQYLVDYMSL